MRKARTEPSATRCTRVLSAGASGDGGASGSLMAAEMAMVSFAVNAKSTTSLESGGSAWSGCQSLARKSLTWRSSWIASVLPSGENWILLASQPTPSQPQGAASRAFAPGRATCSPARVPEGFSIPLVEPPAPFGDEPLPVPPQAIAAQASAAIEGTCCRGMGSTRRPMVLVGRRGGE